ncbi:uncharacterized protein B0H18DRAFT_1129139 [Fomitopsis serialis]|uniref:uncharacterized protein n=1 Tax=Fomitopsis serialis TaxID=139415 RepID=UPI002007DC6B|nr:uncharacterized protein B0H18DRAFT_1129139 [Neoantrodia serialis]KAH9911072.1 hypothetical protein B0H18DRAFT_1129139 [Neoantrodia serialis]
MNHAERSESLFADFQEHLLEDLLAFRSHFEGSDRDLWDRAQRTLHLVTDLREQLDRHQIDTGICVHDLSTSITRISRDTDSLTRRVRELAASSSDPAVLDALTTVEQRMAFLITRLQSIPVSFPTPPFPPPDQSPPTPPVSL